jgi:hypothetical protein
MASPLKMEARGKLRPPKMGCTHIWEIEAANRPTSKGRCRLCKTEKDFANALPDLTPEQMSDLSWRKRQVRKPKPKPEREVTEMPPRGDTKRLAKAKEEAMAMFRDGKRPREVAAALEPEYGKIAISTLCYWKKTALENVVGRISGEKGPELAKRKRESTAVRTATLEASGRDAHAKSTGASGDDEPRQKPIPVTASERAVLDLMKGEVERRLSMKFDWGEFLTISVALGVSQLRRMAVASGD